jgi:hypothetical protein
MLAGRPQHDSFPEPPTIPRRGAIPPAARRSCLDDAVASGDRETLPAPEHVSASPRPHIGALEDTTEIDVPAPSLRPRTPIPPRMSERTPRPPMMVYRVPTAPRCARAEPAPLPARPPPLPPPRMGQERAGQAKASSSPPPPAPIETPIARALPAPMAAAAAHATRTALAAKEKLMPVVRIERGREHRLFPLFSTCIVLGLCAGLCIGHGVWARKLADALWSKIAFLVGR